MLGVDIDRKEHAECDQKQLGFLIDAEPQDHQRNQREMGNVADHLQAWNRTPARNAATARWPARTAKPMLAPMAKPTMARQKLTQMLRRSSPLWSRFHPATATSVGAGRTRPGIQPATESACHTTMMPSGNAHCVKDARPGSPIVPAHDCARLPDGAMFVGDGLAERSGIDARRRRHADVRERKQGKHELGEAVSLFEVRVARQDEGVDAERDVFLHPRRHGLGIANQRRAGAATHQSDAGPQVGADLELVAAAAVQLGHPALTDRVHAGKNLLCIGDRLVAQVPRSGRRRLSRPRHRSRAR